MQKRSNWKPVRRVVVRVLHTLLSCGIVASALAQQTGLHELLFNQDIKSWLYIGFYCASATLSLVFYFIACGVDPGFVPLQSRSSVLVDSDGEDIESCQSESGRMISSGLKLRHCGFCGIEQPLRARHCEECDRCVRCFDHHCPWLGVCVGELNHRYFLLFLLFTATSTVWSAVIIWQAFRPEATVLAWLNSNILFLFDMLILLPAGATVICLAFIHIYTAFANVTTWEFVSKHRITYLKQVGENPFHQGYCKNCFVFLCACRAQRWEETWEKFVLGRTKARGGLLQTENDEDRAL